MESERVREMEERCREMEGIYEEGVKQWEEKYQGKIRELEE